MSRLEEKSVVFRNAILTKNSYNNNKPYNSSHTNSLSDGDEKGKGEVNGSVGGLTDIKTRNTLLTKNSYSNNKPYNASNA